MISMKEFMNTVKYRITEGDSYGWRCYGPNAHQLSAWNGLYNDGGWSANIIFDTENQTVYEVDVCDYTNNRAYRIINPDFKTAYDKESVEHGEFANQAWDDVSFTDLEMDEDWLDKANAIVKGLNYDTRIQIPLDIDDDVFMALAMEAHKRDITINKLIEEILSQYIKEFENGKSN